MCVYWGSIQKESGDFRLGELDDWLIYCYNKVKNGVWKKLNNQKVLKFLTLWAKRIVFVLGERRFRWNL